VNVVHRVPDALWRVSAGRVLVLSPRALGPLLLDAAAARIWLEIEQPTALADLVDQLAPAFPGSRAELEGEVASFVEDLAARGIARITPT
jgi:hypothetical protein